MHVGTMVAVGITALTIGTVFGFSICALFAANRYQECYEEGYERGIADAKKAQKTE